MNNILGTIVSYGVVILLILGIAYVAHFFITAQSTLSRIPGVNSSWVTSFFATIGTNRKLRYTECNQLNSLAEQNYNNYYSKYSGFYYLNNNETILAPMYLETNYIYGVASSTTYGVANPNQYLQELLQNDTQIFDMLMNRSYTYYGFYLFKTEGRFGSSKVGALIQNTTANAINVFVELASACGN